MRTVGQDGRTSCCGAFSTFVDGVECCKKCYEEVSNDVPPTEVNLQTIETAAPAAEIDTDKLAEEFIGALKQWLTADEWAEMCAENATEEDNAICHSHDYCDANMAMQAAFESIGIKVDVDDDAQASAWNTAWNKAHGTLSGEGQGGAVLAAVVSALLRSWDIEAHQDEGAIIVWAEDLVAHPDWQWVFDTTGGVWLGELCSADGTKQGKTLRTNVSEKCTDARQLADAIKAVLEGGPTGDMQLTFVISEEVRRAYATIYPNSHDMKETLEEMLDRQGERWIDEARRVEEEGK